MNGGPTALSALLVGLTVSKVSFEEDGLEEKAQNQNQHGTTWLRKYQEDICPMNIQSSDTVGIKKATFCNYKQLFLRMWNAYKNTKMIILRL